MLTAKEGDLLKNEYNKIEEKALLDRARAGDGEAFGMLVRATERMVYNLALRMTRDGEDALDMSQEAYLRAYRSLASFEGNCSFSSWMYRNVRNVCLDHEKKKKKLSPLTLTRDDDGESRQTDIPDEAASPDVLYEKKERAEAVRRALDLMSESAREILILADIEGYSYREIADTLGVDVGTVKSRLFRARGKFREIFRAAEHL